MYEHIKKHTRIRDTDTPSSMKIKNINDTPTEKSNHLVLEFDHVVSEDIKMTFIKPDSLR